MLTLTQGSNIPPPITCTDCGDPIFKSQYGTESLAGGYGKAHCYECCGRHDRAAMRAYGSATLYVTRKHDSDGYVHRAYTVTNWPGTLEIIPTATSRGEGGFGSQRTDVWFTFEGAKWHGVNRGENDLLRCKRVKGRK